VTLRLLTGSGMKTGTRSGATGATHSLSRISPIGQRIFGSHLVNTVTAHATVPPREPAHVDSLGNGFQMLRVNARRIFTSVVQYQSSRNRANQRFVKEAMSQAASVVLSGQLSMSRFETCALPGPTVSFNLVISKRVGGNWSRPVSRPSTSPSLIMLPTHPLTEGHVPVSTVSPHGAPIHGPDDTLSTGRG
jgi:hypothetical protein